MDARLIWSVILVGLGFGAAAVRGQEANRERPVFSPYSLAREFESRRAAHANLTWEAFERRLPQRDGVVKELGFDPARADYFELVERELALTDDDLETLRREGVLLKGVEDAQSFPLAYYNIYTRDLPLLITTDSILHAFHHSYDKVLQEIELSVIKPRLTQLLVNATSKLRSLSESNLQPELATAARDVDLYLTVARTLLTGQTPPVFAEQQQAIQTLSRSIREANAMLSVTLYGGQRPLDFTQFRPRGHYASDPALQTYFRCMSWLGRADCGLTLLPAGQSNRELLAAALLAQLLKSEVSTWEQMDSVLTFMVGRSDNATLKDLLEAAQASAIESVNDLVVPGRLIQLQDRLARIGVGEQAIRSEVLSRQRDSAAPAVPPRSFQLFGQRFVLDSFVLAQVVHDAIEFNGQRVKRMMPSGLDVMAALGNDEASRTLVPELRQWQYAANLSALQEAIAELPGEYWQQDLYCGWLGAIGKIGGDLTENAALPQVFRTSAWRKKQLQTQLASWSELRHDTILYAKASYSVPDCEFPAAYVEPYPEFFAAMVQLARRASALLKTIPKAADPQPNTGFRAVAPVNNLTPAQFFERMAGYLERLESIARKETRQEALSNEDRVFLQRTVSWEGNVLFGSGALKIQLYDGWYPQLMYGFQEEVQNLWQATIADVHTDPQSGSVLEVGVGKLDYCVAAIDQGGKARLHVGPSYSYYEFAHPASSRLTDLEWQFMLSGSAAPSRPEFIRTLVSPRSRLEPLVTVQRQGDVLKVKVDDRSQRSGKPGEYELTISREGLAQLAQVAPGVRSLDLSGSRISDDELQLLKPLYNLKAVDLQGTVITGSGLSGLAGSRQLRRLSLRNAPAADEALAEVNQWPYLESLDLRGTAITDEGLTQLHRQRYLREVQLSNSKVTPGGAKALAAALPECRVEH